MGCGALAAAFLFNFFFIFVKYNNNKANILKVKYY